MNLTLRKSVITDRQDNTIEHGVRSEQRPLQLLFDLAEAAGAFPGHPMQKERPVADVFNTFGWCSRNTYKSLFLIVAKTNKN